MLNNKNYTFSLPLPPATYNSLQFCFNLRLLFLPKFYCSNSPKKSLSAECKIADLPELRHDLWRQLRGQMIYCWPSLTTAAQLECQNIFVVIKKYQRNNKKPMELIISLLFWEITTEKGLQCNAKFIKKTSQSSSSPFCSPLSSLCQLTGDASRLDLCPAGFRSSQSHFIRKHNFTLKIKKDYKLESSFSG